MAPTIKTALKLLLASFCVGLVLSWIDFNALDVLRSLSGAVHYVVNWVGTHFGRVLELTLLGAMIVVPIALIRLGWRKLKGRRAPPPPRGRQA